MSKVDFIEFHKTIGKELYVIKDRVRHLIGNSHWGEEGRYKEAILINVLKRFLPKNFSIGTGFVVANYRVENHITSQIDIIIYDNTYPTLFQEGDFVVITAQPVRAIIEVKTTVKVNDFENIAIALINNAAIIRNHQAKTLEVSSTYELVEKPQNLFVGLFSYDCKRHSDIYLKKLQKLYSEKRSSGPIDIKKYFINNVALSKEMYLKYTKESGKDILYTSYKMENLAHSYFILNLLRSLNFLAIYPNWAVWFPFDEDQFIDGTVKLNDSDCLGED